MPFTVSFEFIYRYWNQGHIKHEKLFSTSLKSEQKQGRELMLFMSVEVFIYLFIFIKLCCFCKRQDMFIDSSTSLLLQHFWMNFWCLVLFQSG